MINSLPFESMRELLHKVTYKDGYQITLHWTSLYGCPYLLVRNPDVLLCEELLVPTEVIKMPNDFIMWVLRQLVVIETREVYDNFQFENSVVIDTETTKGECVVHDGTTATPEDSSGVSEGSEVTPGRGFNGRREDSDSYRTRPGIKDAIYRAIDRKVLDNLSEGRA